MDSTEKLIYQLQTLASQANNRLLHLYLTLWNNILPILENQGLAEHGTYKYLRNEIPQLDVDFGYSKQDYEKFRNLIMHYFIPGWVKLVHYLHANVSQNVKETKPWKLFNKISLTESFTQIWYPQDGVNDTSVFVCWTPFPTEMDVLFKNMTQEKFEEIEDTILQETKQKLIAALNTRITMLYLGFTAISQIIGFRMLVTPVVLNSDDLENADRFDIMFEHRELIINPLTHALSFKHEKYPDQDLKINGGKIVAPRLSLNDPVVKRLGYKFGDLVMITRENRGRLQTDISQKEIFIRLVGGDDQAI